jgi:imidazolonepropionase-like amidohydrolase
MKFVLVGRVATMDSTFTMVANGAVYIDGNTIAGVADRNAPPPAGFAGATTVDTAGVIFPGLIELHNHLSYDALELWHVPQKFTNRGQWQNNADYKVNVSEPMTTIASSRDARLLAAVARYAETKCLFGGVATSQGISLKGDNMQTSYRSSMRVVDDPSDKQFPRARTCIPDVSASDWTKFKTELEKATCMLLHLSEGIDAAARDAFLALKQGDQWAITSALAGIHCAALQPQDFAVMRENRASVVWSPLSNLLLYGGTTDIRAARAAGLDVALGSDWSPSGSKNLLNELKVAKIANDVLDIGLADRDIVAMVTCTPARIVKWNALVGSVSAGKRADLIVIAAPASADPYGSLINARETDVVLLMIDGQPVLATAALMSAFGQRGETIQLGSTTRLINYGGGDPRLPALTFAESKAAMADALSRLPTLLDDEKEGRGVSGHRLADAARPQLRLDLHEEHSGGLVVRPRLPLNGKPTGPDAAWSVAAKPPPPLKALPLDPATVTDDPNYGAILQAQANIPPAIRAGLKLYYG